MNERSRASRRAALASWLRQPRPKCGGCKATGVQHVWNDQGDLVPADPRQPCPACGGSGWLGDDFARPARPGGKLES